MSKNTRTRILLTAVAALLLVTMAVGGTLAWLTDTSDEVTNTFTPTTLSVDLTETGIDNEGNKDFEMIPGKTLTKDPKVSYTTDVDAYLFVKITESANLDEFIEYTIADGWDIVVKETDGVTVIGRVVATDSNTSFPVLKDNQVTVLDSVNKDMMDAVIGGTDTEPTLAFEAFIIQQHGFSSIEAAWNEVNGEPEAEVLTT